MKKYAPPGRFPTSHGLTAYTYYRCRCDICKAAIRQAQRDWRARRKAG